MPNATILLSTGSSEQRVTLGKALRHAGHEVVDCDIHEELGSWLDAHESAYDIDLAFIDCKILICEEDLVPRLEKALGNEIPVVVLTSYACRQICFRTSTLSIAAFFAPPHSPGEIGKLVSDILRRKDNVKTQRETTIPTQPLTPRERVILRLLVRGLDNDEIARCLGISSETVHYHLKHVFEKLRVKSRTEAATLAREMPNEALSIGGRGK